MNAELKGVHLNKIEHAQLPLRFSKMQQRRARQVQSFLNDLQDVTNKHLGSSHLELFVLSRRDWQQVLRSPYGICVARLRKNQGQLFVSADYPQRLLHQFDDLFLEASFKPPGELSELLDLMLGFEWAYLNLRSRNLVTKDAQLNALRACQLYLLSLQTAGWDGLEERLNLWTTLELVTQKTAKQTLQAPKSQKAVTDRYRLYSTLVQISVNRSLEWGIFNFI